MERKPDGEGHCNPGIMIWGFILNAMDERSWEDFDQRIYMDSSAVSEYLPGCR